MPLLEVIFFFHFFLIAKLVLHNLFQKPLREGRAVWFDKSPSSTIWFPSKTELSVATDRQIFRFCFIVRNFSDRDLEKLYEQWEEDDEPLPVDELPEWDPRKPKPGLDLSDMSKFQEPEDFLKASKKGIHLILSLISWLTMWKYEMKLRKL